ncbi:MAG: hypothetical protein WDW36_004071 [Sanguina aurantia]
MLAQLLLAKIFAASCAEAITFPIDTVKTRLQLQGEVHGMGKGGAIVSGPRKGALGMALQILGREGVHGFYSGLSAGVVRHVLYTGTRLTVYENLRSTVPHLLKREGGPEQSTSSSEGTSAGGGGSSSSPVSSGSGSLGSKLLMGLTAGALGQLVAIPADVIKVRLQADGRQVASGGQGAPRYTGALHALRTIVAQEGVRGLWRGTTPAVQRAALVNLGELATPSHWVQQTGMLPEGVAVHTASSICSGLVAAVVSTPADVMKTRLMTQDPANPRYRGLLDCLVQCVRNEGPAALYKGFLPTWARLGPWQLCFWLTYEQCRSLAGQPSF